MKIRCKYGVVDMEIGDKWPDGEEGEWTVSLISKSDTCEGLHMVAAPVVIAHNFRKQDLSKSHAQQHSIVITPGLVCHLLDELNVRSFVCGQWAAYHAEWAAARLHEHRNGLYHDHIPEYGVVQDDLLLDQKVDHDLELEGIAREVVRSIQNARKKAGLVMEDKILLQLTTDSELVKESLYLLGEYISRVAQAAYGLVHEPLATVPVKIETHSQGKLDMEIKFAKVKDT